MIDLKMLRTQPESLRKAMQDRGGRYLPVLDEALARESRYRELLQEAEALRAKRNQLSESISRLKNPKESDEGKALLGEAGKVKAETQKKEEELAVVEAGIQALLLSLPNLPHPSVPVGKGPEANPVVREDVSRKRSYDFKPLDHHTLGEKLGILDFQTAARLSGSRFVVLKGAGAALERALVSFMLDLHVKEHGYLEIFPPYLVNAQTLTGTAQLPKFEEEQFKTTDEKPLYLIPTAEVPLTNLHAGEILEASRLPLRYCAYSACFRREAGSYGKDTRGLIRQHQFNKVELVWITRPEDSLRSLEELTRHAEEVLRRLEIPYRVVALCTGDMGFSSAKTYDLEVWMPGEGRWREISSCSDCWDFQARRMKTRVRLDTGTAFAHTLNGSGVAVGRMFAAILENYQQADGTVEVPKALRPYLGIEKIVG